MMSTCVLDQRARALRFFLTLLASILEQEETECQSSDSARKNIRTYRSRLKSQTTTSPSMQSDSRNVDCRESG